MIFLTSAEKRDRIISNAIVTHAQGYPFWFSEVQAKIDEGIKRNSESRWQVILKWIKSAEGLKATIVKEEILKLYDQRNNEQEGKGSPIDS